MAKKNKNQNVELIEKLKEMSGYALLTDIANGKYVHFESVRRIRARIQEQTPELRGENYYKRKP